MLTYNFIGSFESKETMERNIEEDMFAEIYYQGAVKRLKKVADCRLKWHAYAVATHLHRMLRSPMLSSKTKKGLSLKIKTFERYTQNNSGKKELSMCNLTKIMEDFKSILGESVFNVTSAEIHHSNLQKVVARRPTPPGNMPEEENVQYEDSEYQYSPLSPAQIHSDEA